MKKANLRVRLFYCPTGFGVGHKVASKSCSTLMLSMQPALPEVGGVKGAWRCQTA